MIHVRDHHSMEYRWNLIKEVSGPRLSSEAFLFPLKWKTIVLVTTWNILIATNFFSYFFESFFFPLYLWFNISPANPRNLTLSIPSFFFGKNHQLHLFAIGVGVNQQKLSTLCSPFFTVNIRRIYLSILLTIAHK